MKIPDKIILVVEDNPDDQLLILRALKQSHIANEIVTAGDGEEALEYLHGTGRYAARNSSPLPQVVLLDLHLPKVDGLQVLQNLRATERTRNLPVVVLTSSDEDRDVVDSYRFGANSFVRKPVDFGEFSAAVKNLGLFWMLINKTAPEIG
jgi:two-component system response regulator